MAKYTVTAIRSNDPSATKLMTKHIFFVSTGRTATEALTYHLNATVDQVAAYHEPRPSFARRAPALITRPHRRSERIYFGIPREWRRLRARKAVYVECNYRLFPALPLIRKTFPSAYVIHIVRDGRTTARSWLNKGRYIQSDDGIKPTDIPSSGVSLEEWLTWSPVKKNAWNWALTNGVIDAQGPDYRVHFEDIFNPQCNHLAQILHEIAPNVFGSEALAFSKAAQTNHTRNATYPAFEQWTTAQQHDFWEMAEKQMAAFGYTNGSGNTHRLE